LSGGEGDEPSRAGGGGRGFEVDTLFRRPGNFRWRLPRFERPNNFVFTPRGKQTEDEFRRMALRENDATGACRAGGRRSVPSFTRSEQFCKRPSPPGGKIAQRDCVALLTGNFPPAFVKHCQFVTARLTSSASELMISAKTNRGKAGGRPFEFERDTFAFANELLWEYQFNPATGKTTFRRREPKPDYAHRCFVLVRAARQFLYHARFDAGQPVPSEETCRHLIREVVSRNPRMPCLEQRQIVIPGYAGLREFRRAHEKLLKAECGSAWRSYFLRSHWRMVFPITRGHQTRTAAQLVTALEQNISPIIHLVKFPSLTINHGMVLFNAVATRNGVDFSAYDPNNPLQPVNLTFDRATATFSLPPNRYWPGGELNVIEIFRNWLI
jgi:hypothetical protein